MVKKTVGFSGEIENDTSKPDGMPLKRLDVTKAKQLGWEARIPLGEGIESAYSDFLNSLEAGTVRL
jgi:GDP-L-fucose synthase